MKHRVILRTGAGTWAITDDKPIRFWLLRLVIEILKHRCWHLWHDGEWKD